MKIAYLIIAYDNPKHLERMIKALSSDKVAFFIHIDNKSNINNFSKIKGSNIYFSKERIPSYWGDFSTVKAILILIQMGLADQCRFDYFSLLSGTDYPLQPVSYIEDFFERNSGKEFINMVQIPCKAAGKPITRLTTYKPNPSNSKIISIIQKVLKKTGIFYRNRDYKSYLQNLIPYGGCLWWSLSRGACEYIKSFVINNPHIVDFFEHTIIPEESFFQTILGNSPYKARIQGSLTYADWSNGGAHPAYITKKHLEFFKTTKSIIFNDIYGAREFLFSRKFSDSDKDIVMQLKQLIKEKEDKKD